MDGLIYCPKYGSWEKPFLYLFKKQCCKEGKKMQREKITKTRILSLLPVQ